MNSRPCLPSQFYNLYSISNVFIICMENMKFLSSQYLSAALHIKVGCFSVCSSDLGSMLTNSLLCLVPASSLAVALAYTAVIAASVTANIIAWVTVCVCAIFPLNFCQSWKCLCFFCFLFAWSLPYFWFHLMLFAWYEITPLYVRLLVYCVLLDYYVLLCVYTWMCSLSLSIYIYICVCVPVCHSLGIGIWNLLRNFCKA